MSGYRVGQGLDVHRVSGDPQRALVLGGVRIPEGPALEGHSDADVVLHALTDALLGAAGLGDLGSRFGVAAPEHAGADSRRFVTAAAAEVAAASWRVGNADLTVVGERPRIAPHRERMVAAVADLLGVEPDAVSVKATTTDRLGFLGRGEGLACLAVVLLERR